MDAGAATTFNTIFGGAGKDTFVLELSGTHWDGHAGDLNHFLTTEIVGANTLLECTTASGCTTTVTELMGTHDTLAALEAHHSLVV